MSTPTDDTGSIERNLSEDELDNVAGGAFELAGRPPTGAGEINEPSYCSGEIKLTQSPG